MSEIGATREPTTPEELIDYGNHLVQYSEEYSLCAGCESCSIMCALARDGFTGPDNCRIKVNLGTRSMLHTVYSCLQCKDHPCYDACPKKDKAMVKNPETQIVSIVKEQCIGCGKCIKACKFTPSRIRMQKGAKRKQYYAVKCDLCQDNPEGPQCIKWCPERCLGLSDDSVHIEYGWVPRGQEDAVRAHAAEAEEVPAKEA